MKGYGTVHLVSLWTKLSSRKDKAGRSAELVATQQTVGYICTSKAAFIYYL